MKKALIFIKSHLYNYWIDTLALAMTCYKKYSCNPSLQGVLIREAIKKKSIVKQKAFTLAEIMIVLSVIAVLTAILLPAARNAMPNENVMKFKKGHNTLLTTISELVNSDKYYLNGDLGVKIDGTLITSANSDNHKYFIQTFADVLSLQYNSPKTGNLTGSGSFGLVPQGCATAGSNIGTVLDNCSGHEVTSEIIEKTKEKINAFCLKANSVSAKQVVTNDGIWFFDSMPYSTFGITEFTNNAGRRGAILKDNNGFNVYFKVFCMDIDGVPSNATKTNCINECPFTYGINTEGKIFTSKKVDEWLEKSIQDKD